MHVCQRCSCFTLFSQLSILQVALNKDAYICICLSVQQVLHTRNLVNLYFKMFITCNISLGVFSDCLDLCHLVHKIPKLTQMASSSQSLQSPDILPILFCGLFDFHLLRFHCTNIIIQLNSNSFIDMTLYGTVVDRSLRWHYEHCPGPLAWLCNKVSWDIWENWYEMKSHSHNKIKKEKKRRCMPLQSSLIFLVFWEIDILKRHPTNLLKMQGAGSAGTEFSSL